MDYRRDILPPFLALAVSLSLHAGLTQVRVQLPDRAEDLDLTPVTVEYLPAPAPGGAPAEPAPVAEPPLLEEPPPAPPRERPPELAAPPEPEPAPQPPPPEPEPETRPADPEEAAAPAAAPPPPPEAALEPPSPNPPPAEPLPEASAPAPSAPQPNLQDLLPRTEDLRTYARAESTPDPAGGQAQEVTLTLGDTDVRYRGYLEQVQGTIDRSWRWREALLAAGGGGQVLVRFSLNPDGQVEDVGVVESSGSPVLDREAAEAVRRAPLPEFPRHWTLQRLHLFAQFGYRLE